MRQSHVGNTGGGAMMGLVIEGGYLAKSKKLDLDAIVDQLAPDQLTEDYLFEICFVVLAGIEAQRQGMSITQFAGEIWSDREGKSARRSYYAMLGTTATGNPQRLPLGKAYRMAMILGKSFSDMSYAAYHRMTQLPVFSRMRR